MDKKYFVTVDWCNKGNRGIFCNRDGTAYFKETEHTQDDFWDILDCFSLILNPQSIAFTEEEVKQYTQWKPLGEFSNQYGVALKKEVAPSPR